MPFFSEGDLNPRFRVDTALRTRYVGLVSCGKSKAESRCRAEKLYTGGLTQKGIEWMKRNCQTWFILSAKFGLLHPDTVIDPYDTKITDLNKEEIARWSAKVFGQLKAAHVENKDLLCIAGKEYFQALEVPEDNTLYNLFPSGMKMGFRMRWFNQHPVLTAKLVKELEAQVHGV